MKKKRIVLSLVALIAAFSIFATACSKNTKTDQTAENVSETDKKTTENTAVNKEKSADKKTEEAKDTIVALLPPVSSGYADKLDEWIAQYEAEHPNIKIDVTKASWEDAEDKLNVMVNAGSPPDVAFMEYEALGKYVDLGMCVNLLDYLDDEQIKDFREDILPYFSIGDAVYGLPAYCDVHSIGGNREVMEAAGIDWKHIQQNGWTFDEFREAIKKGVIKDGDMTKTYGFVFACSGVTASDYFDIFVKSAGFPSDFDENLKYTYTSSKMLTFLKGLRTLIDDGSMPDFLTSVDAGKRWNMFLTGQTMITGKGLTSFEKSAAKNNALLESGGDAVEGSIKVDYMVLPTPTFNGSEQYIRTNSDGYVLLNGKKNPDPQHLKNVADFIYFLASGERAAFTTSDCYLEPICQSGLDAYKNISLEGRNPNNLEAVSYLVKHACPARPDIPTDIRAKSRKISDEVIIPKFQAMLAGEITPEDVYQAIKDVAFKTFGQDGCLLD